MSFQLEYAQIMFIVLYIVVFFSIIFESFPVSSSSHVYLIDVLLAQSSCEHSTVQNVELISHGCYLIVFLFFFRNYLKLFICNLRRSIKIIKKMVIQGFIVECVTLTFYILVKGVKGMRCMPLMYMVGGLALTSFLLYSLKFLNVNGNKKWTARNSFVLGAAQGIALFPGVSRFAATFVCSQWMGISSKRGFELSFLIGSPLNAAACTMGFYRLLNLKSLHILSGTLMISMLVASIGMYGGLIVVRYIIHKKKLWMFSFYTSLLSLIVMVMFFWGSI